jgi:hypothetical protein
MKEIQYIALYQIRYPNTTEVLRYHGTRGQRNLFTQLWLQVFAYCLSSSQQLVRMVSWGRIRRSCPLAARSSDRSCARTPMLTPSSTYAASNRYGNYAILVMLFRIP